MTEAPTRAGRELQMLEAMVDCAHGLGVAFAAATRAEAAHARKLELFDAFHRSFLSFRLGIRLSLTLRAPPRAPAAAAAETEAAERPEVEDAVEPSDTHDPVEREARDADRDREPVSLPRFLANLRAAAADAARMAGSLPPQIARETLPSLDRLLAEAQAGARPGPGPEPGAPAAAPPPAGATALLARPAAAAPAPRARLLASASPPPVLPRPPPRRSG